MKRKLLAVSAVVCLFLSASVSMADSIFSRSYGTAYLILPGAGGVASGELIECSQPLGEGVLLRVDFIYAQLQGVCDDRGDQACDGKMIGIIERCTADTTEYTAGGLNVGYSGPDNPSIICHDPTGSGSCTAVEQVASAASGAFAGRAMGSGFDLTIATLNIDKGKRFRFEGRKVRLPKISLISTATVEHQVGPFPANCLFRDPVTGGGGCGFTAVAVTAGLPHQHKSHKSHKSRR
jgi:hypothetical protein